jgi:hypothetical protein
MLYFTTMLYFYLLAIALVLGTIDFAFCFKNEENEVLALSEHKHMTITHMTKTKQ